MSNKQIIRVRDVMKTDFHIIQGRATVSEAVQMMKEKRSSMLIVDKHHENDEYGIINAGTIAKQVLALNRSPDRVNVYEINEKPLIMVTPEMDIRYCSRLFARYNLMRAPVVKDGEIIGIVSPVQLVLDGLCGELGGLLTDSAF